MRNHIAQAFNQAAKTYDEFGNIQHQAGQKLIGLLEPLNLTFQHIIDLGCGTGHTTKFLADQQKAPVFHAIDIAPLMLEQARLHLANNSAHVYEMDFDRIPRSTPTFDLVFSSMALQWSTNLTVCLNQISKITSLDGHVLFCLPTTGTFSELHSHFAINPFHNASVIQSFLQLNGFKIIKSFSEKFTAQFPDTISALKSIKHTGANHVVHRQEKGLRPANRFKSINITELTYFISFFLAQKVSQFGEVR